MIKLDWRCTWRPWLSEFGGHNGANLEIHLEVVIEWTYWCTLRLWSGECGDALGSCNWATLEIDLEGMIVWTWRPKSSKFGDSLGGRDPARLDEYLEAVGGLRAGCCDSIHHLVNSQPWECDMVIYPVRIHGELADCGRSCSEARRKLQPHSGVNS